MGFWNRFLHGPEGGTTAPQPRADSGSATFLGLSDPALADFLSAGGGSSAGVSVSIDKALRNSSVERSVSLISYSIGTLPLNLIDLQTKLKAEKHPVQRLLHGKPNKTQTAFEFRSMMQARVLIDGAAYARIVRSKDIRTGRPTVTALLPLDRGRIYERIAPDWTRTYRYQPSTGPEVILQDLDVFRVGALCLDRMFPPRSLVSKAADVIGLALAADLAASRLFRNGSMVDSVLKTTGKLSDQAYARLQAAQSAYQGADNAGKTPILEEGLDFTRPAGSAKDAQLIEVRKMQIEEIARIFGVPRPLLMVDDTSWGSGIEALARFFVMYALINWFEAWEQACNADLLADDEVDRYATKFNPGALLRGSMADQSAFFGRALGSAGAPGWMTSNEVRDYYDMPPTPDGDSVSTGMTAPASPSPAQDAPAPKPKEGKKNALLQIV